MVLIPVENRMALNIHDPCTHNVNYLPPSLQIKGIKKFALKKACSYHSGEIQANSSLGQARKLLDWDTTSGYAVLRAYSITAGDVVKAQV